MRLSIANCAILRYDDNVNLSVIPGLPMLRLISNLQRYTRDALSDPLRRLQLSVAVIVLLNIFGTLMYVLLEGWSPIDALYMTVITIATVGYGEVRELSAGGRVFTIVLIYLGVGAATTAITNAVSLALGPVLWGSLRRRRLKRMIENIENHYIVCGYGRMGRQIIHDLKMRDEPFVLVDTNEDLEDELTDNKVPYIMGDATQDENLYNAGIERARGFVAALNSDAGNIMAVLTARELNPRLFIVARVVRQESESKLRRAGANRVINPYQIGGHRIALALVRPAVNDFLDRIFHFETNLFGPSKRLGPYVRMTPFHVKKKLLPGLIHTDQVITPVVSGTENEIIFI